MNDQYFIAFLGALTFLGILITWGNERQRRAIDGIRKATTQWANCDIHIKRGQVSREIHIENIPLWFNHVVLQAIGNSPEILNIEQWNQDGIQALIASAKDGKKYILCPTSGSQIRKLESTASRQSKINGLKGSLLGRHSKRVASDELTIINAGIFFDLEVTKLWEQHFQKKLVVEKMFLFTLEGPNA